MRKRYTQTDINSLFNHLKEQPPIYNEEKVHQIISRPDAKARLKGKTNNLLKFTIMTTILAFIISAVLLWPNSEAKLNITTPITKQVGVNQFGSSENSNQSESIQKNTLASQQAEINLKEQVQEKSFDSIQTISSGPIEVNKMTYPIFNKKSKQTIPIGNDSLSLTKSTGDLSVKEADPMVSMKSLSIDNQILDSTYFIELNNEELIDFGFKYENQTISLTFNIINTNWIIYIKDSTASVSLNFEDNSSSDSMIGFLSESITIQFDSIQKLKENSSLVPMLVTNSLGVECLKLIIPQNKQQMLFSSRFDKDYKTLLPIRIRKNTFGNQPKIDMVYWFLPTDEFFNKLPQRITTELFKEYHYVVSEDKSILEKPECKYFDECKNTLKVSRFKAFPNPANEHITVTFTLPDAINGKISLVDLAGRERKILQPTTSFSKGNQQLEFSINEIPEGIYLLLLYADEGIQTQRIIVTR